MEAAAEMAAAPPAMLIRIGAAVTSKGALTKPNETPTAVNPVGAATAAPANGVVA